jgi:hypothetical protein
MFSTLYIFDFLSSLIIRVIIINVLQSRIYVKSGLKNEKSAKFKTNFDYWNLDIYKKKSV